MATFSKELFSMKVWHSQKASEASSILVTVIRLMSLKMKFGNTMDYGKLETEMHKEPLDSMLCGTNKISNSLEQLNLKMKAQSVLEVLLRTSDSNKIYL